MAKILVVDDTKLISTLIARVLCSAGHQVEVALCATDAWKILENRSVDLMLLDLEMPHMGGLDLLDTLRKIPEWADLPTIVVSGRKDDLPDGLAARADRRGPEGGSYGMKTAVTSAVGPLGLPALAENARRSLIAILHDRIRKSSD